MKTVTEFDARRLDVSARALAGLFGGPVPHYEGSLPVADAVDVIATAARAATTCRHVQAAVTAAAAGCDVEAILRAAGVLGADGKPTTRWEVVP